MQKIKYLLWLIIVFVVVTFIYQNNEYFMAEQRIGIDLYFYEAESGDVPNLIYFLIVFALGFLVSLVLLFSYGYKKRKTIRELNNKVSADKKRIQELESRLEAMQGAAYSETEPPGPADKEKALDTEFSRT